MPGISEASPTSPTTSTRESAHKEQQPAATQASAKSEPRDLIRFGSRSAKPKAAGAVRLVTYNVENLFDDKDDPALSGEHDDKGNTKPESACKGAAAAIRLLDADIIAVEEVESLEALTWFRDGWLSDLGYTYIASVDAGDARGIEQGVLSRYPIKNIKNWPRMGIPGVHPANAPDAEPGSPLTLHRSPLKVDVVIGDGPDSTLTLFVVHHKSAARSAYWREAEAKKVIELIKTEEASNPGRPVAILGDFNTTPDQPTVQTYITGGMIDVFADRIAGDPAWVSHESGRAIDLILGNQAFVSRIAGGSHFILGVPARPAGSDWRTTPPPEGYGSDHYPVVVDLTFAGAKPVIAPAGSKSPEPKLQEPKGGGR
ncbi:MAG: endonuclease/exonuclease/phosphatase family protein [Phycisphaerales bacterium]|nr:endonuclease/exonuclease/phosphatase family protein [Phycisphaerales bacterium]